MGKHVGKNPEVKCSRVNTRCHNRNENVNFTSFRVSNRHACIAIARIVDVKARGGWHTKSRENVEHFGYDGRQAGTRNIYDVVSFE